MKISQKLFVLSFSLSLFLITVTSCNDSITPPTKIEPDTTSHDIVWEADTLGDWNSRLNDVWGSSPDNIWAVGWIKDGPWGSNIIHYDGNKWEPFEYYEADLHGIFGLNENDIWAVGSNLILTVFDALIAHYDGTEWKTVHVASGTSRLVNVWASDANNVFAVGFDGVILHFNGTNWTKMNSGTSKNLFDVWGFADNDVYACGGDINNTVENDKPILLHYNGATWKNLIDTTQYDNAYLQSVWGTSSDNIYFSSTFGFNQGNISVGWTSSVVPDDHTEKNRLRGSSSNNIFITGHFGLLLHYNGNTWHRYNEFFSKSYPYGPYLEGIMAFDKKVFIVGTEERSVKGIVYKGTIKN